MRCGASLLQMRAYESGASIVGEEHQMALKSNWYSLTLSQFLACHIQEYIFQRSLPYRFRAAET